MVRLTSLCIHPPTHPPMVLQITSKCSSQNCLNVTTLAPSKRNTAAGAGEQEACARESSFRFGDCANVNIWDPANPGGCWAEPAPTLDLGLRCGVGAGAVGDSTFREHPHIPTLPSLCTEVICRWSANTNGVCDPETKQCYITYDSQDAVRELLDILQLFISKDAIQDFKCGVGVCGWMAAGRGLLWGCAWWMGKVAATMQILLLSPALHSVFAQEI